MELRQTATSDTYRSNLFHRKPYRLALIGCGPRGLYCLDALSRTLARVSSDAIAPRLFDITIFEPSPHPGAGNVYAVDQPRILRMNFASQRIDAWIDDEVRTRDQLNLVDWLAIHDPEYAAPEGYAPRSIVGEYLHDCYRQVLRVIDQYATITLHREKITDIERIGTSWRVQSSNESVDVDEVVLTVGHEGWRAGKCQRNPGRRSDQHIESVFPVQEQLTPEKVPPNCSVAVRGFGLTAIDAALSLTEGRGGRFQRSLNGFVYHSSGDEPRVISPFSRTGRPMLAKPIPSLVQVSNKVDEIWEAGRDSLQHTLLPIDKAHFHERIWQPILDTAQRVLDKTRIDACVFQWWNDWRSTRFAARRALVEMRQSIAVAYGKSPVTPAWALAETWRQLYPVLVNVVSHGGLTAGAWERFRPIAVEMERIAYGPPAENLARIMALIEAEMIDLSDIADPKESIVGRADIDVVVNAVLPAPTDLAPGGPLAKEVKRGRLRRLNQLTGIEIERAGRPRSASGETWKDIAIFGRVTEGCVLGNDTLSRRLQPHIQNWATEVVAKVKTNS
ncbi:FAD/NAD(P)-binding protein [Thalassoroseus pseudoceratinae]|uniref:FAD/NAD(P)-binding protein n=1 Tax=Thalassoroseus pseudoceratinae TaxID=2713176 RepID=UPI00142236D4|nr:FAD/NAD(P)-binding domain-containing protein [Thalassoroseus pseudoceratinae]